MGHPKEHPPFRDLLPPLTSEERTELEAEIKIDGAIREPLTVWKDLLADGYHRLEVAKVLGYEYKIRTLDPSLTEADVKVWILRHQLGRRNLTPEAYKIGHGRLYNAEIVKNREKTPEGKFCPLDDGTTAERIAKDAGVSTRTIKNWGRRAEIVDSLPVNVRKHEAELTDAQIATLDGCERIAEVDAAIRMGRAPDIKTAYQQVTGKKLSGAKSAKPKPPRAPEPPKPKQPDILKRRDGWRASIVKLRESMQEALNGYCGELTEAKMNALREASEQLDEAYKTLGRIR